MLALAALAGLLTVLLVAAVRVAYLAVPSGRLCPECGFGTSPVALGGPARMLGRWIQRRWCSRCGWEGVGRKGPDVALHQAPVDHDSGFRWQRPDGRQVPIFWWGSEEETFGQATPPLRRRTDDAPTPEPGTPDHPSGFRFRDEPPPPPRPRPRTFRWKQPGG